MGIQDTEDHPIPYLTGLPWLEKEKSNLYGQLLSFYPPVSLRQVKNELSTNKE